MASKVELERQTGPKVNGLEDRYADTYILVRVHDKFNNFSSYPRFILMHWSHRAMCP